MYLFTSKDWEFSKTRRLPNLDTASLIQTWYLNLVVGVHHAYSDNSCLYLRTIVYNPISMSTWRWSYLYRCFQQFMQTTWLTVQTLDDLSSWNPEWCSQTRHGKTGIQTTELQPLSSYTAQILSSVWTPLTIPPSPNCACQTPQWPQAWQQVTMGAKSWSDHVMMESGSSSEV